MAKRNSISQPETPDQIAGNYEAPSYIYNEFGPIPIAGLHVVDFWEKEYSSYFKRRNDSNRLIDQCRAQGDCNPRVADWLNLVDRLKSSGFSDRQKAETVNAWVNEAIRFDDNKDDKIPLAQKADRHQTSLTTLTRGMGMCDDIATLKYETLRAAGVSDGNMRLISGYLYDGDGPKGDYGAHMVLMVNAEGRNYILDDNLTSDGWELKHGGVELAAINIQGRAGGSRYNDAGRFIPIASQNETGGILYYGVTKNGNGDYVLSTIKYNPADPASTAQICAANSCIDMNRKNIDPAVLEQIRQLILQAHNLNPERMSPSPQAEVKGQAPPVNQMPDRLEFPAAKRYSMGAKK